MTPFAESLLYAWRKNGERAQALFANIPDGDIAQPAGALNNHPAWVLSHLVLYHPAIVSLARGELIEDPANLPNANVCGRGSKPVPDAKLYLSRTELITRFAKGHEQIEAAIAESKCDVFTSEPRLERWATAFGTGGAALAYLMLFHESHHLAEIADWKKVRGLSVIG